MLSLAMFYIKRNLNPTRRKMEMPDFIKTLLRTAAPTLLAALGLPPPFNNIAASVVTGALEKYLPASDSTAGAESAKPPLTPAQVTDVVQRNASNPDFILALKQAEADLRKYELDAGIRFTEVEVRDRTRAGDFQVASGLSEKTFIAGMSIVGIAMLGMIFMIGGSLYVAFGGVSIPKDRADLSIAAFGLIGTAVGFINGIAATIVSFYYGSSQSSKEKGEAISATVRDLGQELGRAAINSSPPTSSPSGTQVKQNSWSRDPNTKEFPSEDIEPATPALHSLIKELLPELTTPHRHFPESVSWALGKRGIAIDGAAAQGTAGDPLTVRRIWSNFGEQCKSSARTFGVPIELIVATIATESSGNPNARRAEPKINDESVGLMQTLVGTARSALGRRSLRGDDLLDPATSIAAGTAYIAQQRGQTHFDPPRVAAAYNAGSIRRDSGANRWKMLCYPTGTGHHIDRFVCWFNDCIVVAAADNWGDADTPSFAATLDEKLLGIKNTTTPLKGAATNIRSNSFPMHPDFLPLKNTAARQALFGKFEYVSKPLPNNKEHIDILGDWVDKNIVNVQVTDGPVAGIPGPLTIKFHVKAAEQVRNLWIEWESAGLLDRIITYDGSFVPRFIRGSNSSLSCHSFGCAFDLNADFNKLNTMPPLVGQKGSVRELVEIANKHGFFWGGHFRTRSDGMHFEIAKLV